MTTCAVLTICPSLCDVIVNAGGVLSRLTLTVAVALLPALSVAVPVTVWFAPSVLTTIGRAEESAGAPSASAALARDVARTRTT